MLAEAEADESSQLEAYEKLTQDNAVTKATKTADAKGKTNEVKQLKVSLDNYKENKATLGDELDAVLMYLDKLKPQCESKVLIFPLQWSVSLFPFDSWSSRLRLGVLRLLTGGCEYMLAFSSFSRLGDVVR